MCCRLPLLFAAVVLHAQAGLAGWSVRSGPLPGWHKPYPLSLDEESRKPIAETSAGLEYLVVDEQTDVATSASTHHVAYRVTGDSCLSEGSQISIDFDPEYETIEFHFLRLWREGQLHDRLDLQAIKTIQQERDLERLIYNGRLTALVLMPDVRVGDAVEYAYTRHGANPVLAGKFVDRVRTGWGRAMRHQRYRLIGPRAHTIHSRAVGAQVLKESTSTGAEPGRTWEAHDLPPHAIDEGVPGWFVRVPYLELSEFSSWAHVVRWAIPLYAVREPASEVGATAARLTRRARSEEDKVLALIDFVQRDIRYLGIELGPGSHQPRLPEHVLDRRFGDCKDKARLLCALLREIRVAAAPVLVHSYRHGKISSDLPSPSSFNHVIVRMRLAGRDHWIDPTASSQRGRLASRGQTVESLGLVIAPETEGLTRIPPEQASLPRVLVEETFDQSKYEGPTRFVVVYRFLGDAANRLRSYLKVSTAEEVSRNYLSYFKDRHPELVEKATPRWSDDEGENVVRLELCYELPRLWQPLPGRRNAFEADFTPLDLAVRLRQPQSLARQSPLSLTFPDSLKVTTTINLPEAWALEPTEHRMDTSFLRFQARTFSRGSTVRLTYDWDSLVDHVPAGELSEYVADLESVRSMTSSVLIHDPDSARFALNWLTAGLALGTVVGGTWLAGRAYRRRPERGQFRPEGPLRLIPQAPSLFAPEGPPEQFPPEAMASVPPEVSSPRAPEPPAGRALGGWLWLPAISLVVRPWALLYPLVSNAATYFDHRIWVAYTTAGSPDYSLGMAALLAYEVVANLGLVVLDVFAALLFLKRRREAPRTMIALIAASLILMVVDLGSAHFVPGTSGDHAQNARAISQSALAALVWIPYFLTSRRVRETFVH